MAATFEWNEDTGATAGATRATAVTQVNWKNANDTTTTAYNAAPITAGSNSYHKYQFGKFTGGFTRVYGAKWAWTGKGTPDATHQDIDGVKVKLVGKVDSVYAQPTTAVLAGASTLAVTTIDAGLAVKFSTVGPNGALTTDTGHGQGAGYDLTAPGYTQYLVTQLQTTVAAVAGDTVQATFTLQYNEN